MNDFPLGAVKTYEEIHDLIRRAREGEVVKTQLVVAPQGYWWVGTITPTARIEEDDSIKGFNVIRRDVDGDNLALTAGWISGTALFRTKEVALFTNYWLSYAYYLKCLAEKQK